MKSPIGIHVWHQWASVSRPEIKDTQHYTIVYDDGSTSGGSVRGPDLPESLRDVPLIGWGGRSASGRTEGLDFAEVSAGRIQRGTAADPRTRDAHAACVAAMRRVAATA